MSLNWLLFLYLPFFFIHFPCATHFILCFFFLHLLKINEKKIVNIGCIWCESKIQRPDPTVVCTILSCIQLFFCFFALNNNKNFVPLLFFCCHSFGCEKVSIIQMNRLNIEGNIYSGKEDLDVFFFFHNKYCGIYKFRLKFTWFK